MWAMEEPQSPTQPEEARPTLESLVDAIVGSYASDDRTEHIDSTFLPNRDEAIVLLHQVRDLVFPGFFGPHKLTCDNQRFHAGEMVQTIRESLDRQIEVALRYSENLLNEGGGDRCAECGRRARELTDRFLHRVPDVRAILAEDVQAAFDGDPAARNTDETVFCYPGVLAVFTYRIAHELADLGVPLIPRILTEWAHSETGIDIHPGATIGRAFFVDHGTGVVIGETTIIGDRVKLYQGVTLGALSFPKDERGRLIRGHKRHPTIEDDVIIYAGATVLGGNTVVGRGSVVGGGVFVTQSVPPGHQVTMKSPELKYRAARDHSPRAE